CQQHYITPYTF
nr:immunoglobulin light chain junction region [Mus musculus]